jgi:uncharacterized protein (TIGR02246 family)
MERPTVTRIACLLPAAILAMTVAGGVEAQDQSGSADRDMRSELADLQAREAIRELLHAYGRLIDARDFDAFADLWAEDAAYVGGPGGEPVRGGREIAELLQGIFAENPMGLGEPNFHIFFNEHIAVEGDHATGESMSAFVAPAPDGRPAIVILASYEDEYVLEEGAWKFASRVVRGRLSGPAQ